MKIRVLPARELGPARSTRRLQSVFVIRSVKIWLLSSLMLAFAPSCFATTDETVSALKLQDENGDAVSVWAHLRIKKETFDVSGGWVNSSTPKGQTLTHEPFLKTLRRMHVNTSHIGQVPGCTDQTGPDGLYTRYLLKYFGRLWSTEQL